MGTLGQCILIAAWGSVCVCTHISRGLEAGGWPGLHPSPMPLYPCLQALPWSPDAGSSAGSRYFQKVLETLRAERCREGAVALAMVRFWVAWHVQDLQTPSARDRTMLAFPGCSVLSSLQILKSQTDSRADATNLVLQSGRLWPKEVK